MSTASVFNKLADVMGSALANAFPDTLTVVTMTETAGTGGGRIKASTTNTYTSVPCVVEYIQKFGWRKDQADRNVSTQKYTVTMPTHLNGTRMTLNPATQRLVVAARGDEPEYTLRIDTISSDMGVVFIINASKEN
jgi:hypothetical protein